MVLKLKSFFLISVLMLATSALVDDVSAALSGRETLTRDIVPHAISPGPQIEEGPVAEAPAVLPPGLAFLRNNDPTAIELAQFAIDDHNKEAKDALKFSGILEAVYANREGGKSYSLLIAATNNTETNTYAAKILVDGGHKKLIAFKELV